MGDEIHTSLFTRHDFVEFQRRLERETRLLSEYFSTGRHNRQDELIGFELEAWLVDADGKPASENETFLHNLNNALVVPELSRFNIEMNGSPTSLQGRAFSRLEDELQHTWRACCEIADRLRLKIATIGILPSVELGMLNPENMSLMTRFTALNDQVMAIRKGVPFRIEIEGRDSYHHQHPNLMLEAAATSFQIHFQVKTDLAVPIYNASLAISAPIVALSANSPYLFGHDLWDETRIPLFEQAVAVGKPDYGRVTFGSGYAEHSLLEIFEENLEHYPILIPALFDEPPEKFAHLRFHNGTIWRWNRPLTGFDHEGNPHLRIEHRCVPAGPSIRDCIANAAFYFGVVSGLCEPRAIAPIPSFTTARHNLQAAACDGLQATLTWLDSEKVDCTRLILEELLPTARRGLRNHQIPETEISLYLDIIEARVTSGRNGAAWQRSWIERHGKNYTGLTKAYMENMATGTPVHEWPI